MLRSYRSVLIAITVVVLAIHWALPVLMPVDDNLLYAVGPNVNWIIVVTLLIAVVCLGLIVAPTLDRKKTLLILLGVLLDQGIGELVYRLDLPLYLDTIGCILVGALLGPAAGAFTASVSCSLWIIIAPSALPFSLASIVTGWFAGLVAKLDGFSNWLTTVVSGVIAGLAVGILSAPLTYILLNSPLDREEFDLFCVLEAAGDYFTQPFTFWRLIADPIDKILIFLLVFWVAPLIAKRYWPDQSRA